MKPEIINPSLAIAHRLNAQHGKVCAAELPLNVSARAPVIAGSTAIVITITPEDDAEDHHHILVCLNKTLCGSSTTRKQST